MLKRRFKNQPGKDETENKVSDNVDVNQLDTDNVEIGDETATDDDPEIMETSDSDLEEMTKDVPDELDAKMAVLQAELSESKEKYLRLAAEFDNYRKRTFREKTELIQTAGESLLKDILPLVDDFERGLASADKAENMDAIKEGMDLIYNKLCEFLSAHGIKEVNVIHEPFNADLHDAITNIPAPSDDMKGKIVDVIQKGYTLYDKIIRYPKVVVGE